MDANAPIAPPASTANESPRNHACPLAPKPGAALGADATTPWIAAVMLASNEPSGLTRSAWPYSNECAFAWAVAVRRHLLTPQNCGACCDRGCGEAISGKGGGAAGRRGGGAAGWKRAAQSCSSGRLTDVAPVELRLLARPRHAGAVPRLRLGAELVHRVVGEHHGSQRRQRSRDFCSAVMRAAGAARAEGDGGGRVPIVEVEELFVVAGVRR